MKIEQYQKLDKLISQGATGTPTQLAKKLGICERTVKHMIKELKEKCDAPIEYNRKKATYHYTIKGRGLFLFQPCLKEKLTSTVKDTAESLITTIMKTLSCLHIISYIEQLF